MSQEKLLYTIGEVADMIGESTSLIRFWEKEFTVLKPVKSEKGTRKYTKKEIAKIQLIHHLVKTKGYTLDGAKAYLKARPENHDEAELLSRLHDLKKFLTDLKSSLSK